MQNTHEKALVVEVSRAHIRQLLDYVSLTGLPLSGLSVRQKTFLVGFHWLYSESPEISLMKAHYVEGGVGCFVYGKKRVLVELVNDESINPLFRVQRVGAACGVCISALDSYKFLTKHIG
jgi:hypothetical protein